MHGTRYALGKTPKYLSAANIFSGRCKLHQKPSSNTKHAWNIHLCFEVDRSQNRTCYFNKFVETFVVMCIKSDWSVFTFSSARNAFPNVWRFIQV